MNDDKKNKNTSLALCAAWTETCRNLNSKRNNQNSASSLFRFVGFVDGRLASEIPYWWENLVTNAEVREKGEIYFPRNNFWLYDREDHGLNTMPDLPAKLIRNQVEFEIDGKSIEIRQPEIEARRPEIVSILNTGKFAYVVMASLAPRPSTLAKVDILTGKEVWRQSVRGDKNRTRYQGRNFHFVEAVLGSDDQVYVFGAGGFCVYIEAFKNESGKPVLRFYSRENKDVRNR